MSYMVARMQKMKAGNLGGAYKHNERVFETHSNKDIDPSRSPLNYELTDRDRSVSYERQIKDYVNENKISNRAIRKDAVLCDEWIITSDKSFFEKLSEGETREFFETAKNYFAENYGEDNIAYASVHLDESTPHMHMGVVPFENGKLSSKAMFDREELKKIQDELPKYMNEHGFDLQRGELNSEAKHKTVAEFKKDLATTEVQQELDRLNEVLKEKYEELDKIELRASESLSELDKYKNDINALEDTKRALETEIGAYKDELRDSRTLKQKDGEYINVLYKNGLSEFLINANELFPYLMRWRTSHGERYNKTTL